MAEFVIVADEWEMNCKSKTWGAFMQKFQEKVQAKLGEGYGLKGK